MRQEKEFWTDIPLRIRRPTSQEAQHNSYNRVDDAVQHDEPPALEEAVDVEDAAIEQEQRQLDEEHGGRVEDRGQHAAEQPVRREVCETDVPDVFAKAVVEHHLRMGCVSRGRLDVLDSWR